jgi:alpha-D-ribose 1-methylphosphonate 5-triphosphate synthase subunit PhnL
MNDVMIEVENLHKSFVLHLQGGTRIPVLAGAALTVSRGECVLLDGASGSGKSTLLRCLYGNYRPQSGRVLVRDGVERVDIVTAPPRRVLALRRDVIGFISQFLRAVPRVAARDVVAEPLVDRGVAAEAARERADELLERLRIPSRLRGLPPATFSGGEQQRVNIARGLIAGHPVLLVDEPTASLDEENRAVVIELLREARDQGAAIVGIFHDRAVRDALCTRRYAIADARDAA